MYNAYNEYGANQLAREYTRRGQFFFMQWFSSDDPNFEFSPEIVALYPPNAEFELWRRSLPVGSPAAARAERVASYRPRYPEEDDSPDEEDDAVSVHE